MARRPTERQLFAELEQRYGPEIAKAFLATIDDLRTNADLQRVVAAIQAGNIEAAIEALNLDAAAFDRLLDSFQAAYVAAGEAAVTTMPTIRDVAGARVIIRFGSRNLRAEGWLREESSTLVTRILREQRVAVRQALVAGMEKGAAPRTIGLDIVGRIDKATGKRAGGVLGLSGPQEQYVRTARAELASSDPVELGHYLTRTRRDKRFDRSVTKAIREGTTVPAEIQRKALSRYEARLLELRGQIIGRKEAMTALQAGKHEAYLQAVDSGAIAESAVRRTWRSAGDLRVRHTHVGLNGDTVGLRQPFVSPSGARLMFPGDPSAPADETIGCRCDVSYRIDFLFNLE